MVTNRETLRLISLNNLRAARDGRPRMDPAALTYRDRDHLLDSLTMMLEPERLYADGERTPKQAAALRRQIIAGMDELHTIPLRD